MKRPAQVALLCLGGLGLPMGGWFQAGVSDARRGEEALVSRARAAADGLAQGGAERLAARLEGLRSIEDRRPYFHYQNLYHDPRGASVGPSVIPSPLSEGPSDPLIEAYFQIDGAGKVTLPTLNDEVPAGEDGPGQDRQQQRAVRSLLQREAPALSAAPESERAQAPRAARQDGLRDDSQDLGNMVGSGGLGNEMQIAKDSYAQNSQANRIYLDLKSARKPNYRLPDAAGDNVGISTEPLRWRIAALDGKRRLVALRRTATPDGVLTQGFLLGDEAMRGVVGVARASLRAEAAASLPREASASVGATGLRVALDRAGEEAAARAEAADEWRRFVGLFSLSSLVVLAAGVAVVAVVQRAERLASERSRFAASAAHELRTPLAGLRMYAEMLAEGLGDQARHDEYARRVALEAERLGRVVGNVLGFTRLERDALQVKPRPGDLASFVEEATLRLMPWADAMGVSLDLSIESTPEVPFDTDAATQVLQNLIDNAEKYGRNAADRSVVVATREHEGGAEFAVIDRGPGVKAGLEQRLFTPFARTEDPDDPPGLGLGLSLAHALVEAHGGRLRFEPTPGGGATFRAWFPRGAAAGGRAAVASGARVV